MVERRYYDNETSVADGQDKVWPILAAADQRRPDDDSANLAGDDRLGSGGLVRIDPPQARRRSEKARMSPLSKVFIALGSSFVGVAVLLMLIGGVVGGLPLLPNPDRETTTATITDPASTTITYEVDGETYEVSLSESFTGDKVGDQIEVSYQKDQPTNVRTTRSSVLVLSLLCGIGAVFGAIGLPFLLVGAIRHRRAKKALAVGEEFSAEIVGVAQDFSVQINGRHPWQICCQVYLPDSEDPLKVYSPDWLENPQAALQASKVTTLPVYVDLAHPKKTYYVDDSILREPR